jgi:sugar diacid utilization regulator
METKKIGRPKKMGIKFEIKKRVASTLEKYFMSEEFIHDIGLKNGNNRLKTHLNILPYVLPKAESIKAQMLGLNEHEMKQLVQSVKEELSKRS